MARHNIIIFISLLLCASCAQIGTISGGETDVNAPAPVKMQPVNESTRFSGNEISITFNEYFKVVSPSQNIIMVPPHATIQPSVNKKTLNLSWADTLSDNTTYSIYLNGAVADITEGNDSVYQYVFSTGDVLDSISYTTFLADARSGDAKSNMSIICYNKNAALISLGQSQFSGEVTVQYLKPGSYSFIALDDVNNNLKVDPGESVGFPEFRSIELDSSIIDSSIIRMFKPKAKPRLRTAKFVSPGSVFIGANESLLSSSVYLDGNEVDAQLIEQLDYDSLRVFPTSILPGYHELVVKSELFTDTLNFRVPRLVDSTIRISSNNSSSGVPPSQSVSYETNDRILSVEKDSIRLFNILDSTYITDFSIKHEYNRLYFEFDRDQMRDLKVSFGKDAIVCVAGTSKEWTDNVVLNELRSYGQLIVDHSAYQVPVILELYRSGSLIRSIEIEKNSATTTISELLPGNYTINIIVDRNENGRWDTGDLENFTQPEEIDRYSNPIIVRANWDLEVPLKPAKKQ